ncbi:MAG: hypothetical protein JNM68_12020, partial [Dinghuibacter sp.]|nr:hypothetical protein [Dinghuibacter sp.]
MKANRYMALLGLLLMLTGIVQAQSDIIEIDTLTGSATKTMPYNRPFTVKIQIDADDVGSIYFIKKHKARDFAGSLEYYINRSSSNSYPVPEIPGNYYYVRKIGEKNFLFITFADDHMLEPSSAYYIPILQKKLGSSVLGFFDNFYKSQYGPAAERATALDNAREALDAYEHSMRKVFGDILFAFYTVAEFNRNIAAF